MKSSKFNPKPVRFGARIQNSKFREVYGEIGQSLVEIIVSVGLIMVTVVALLTLSVMSMKGSGYGVSKARATKLANEEMELVRGYRDSMEWTDFWEDMIDSTNCQSGSNNCFINSTLILTTPEDMSVPPFTRYFSVADVSGGLGDKLKVVVIVSWTDQSGSHNVTVSSILANWR